MRLLAILVSVLFVTAGTPAAQDRETPPGWSLYPSASVGLSYDDNLFFRRQAANERLAEGTVYTRFGLTLDATHRGRTSSFSGGYSVGGEYFTGEDEDLTQIPSDQRVFVNATTALGQRSSLQTGASYNISRNPNRVFQDIDLALGRRRAEGYSASVAFNRTLSQNSSLGIQYSLGYQKLDGATEEEVDDDPLARESISHQAGMSWSHTIGERTGGTLLYSYRLFENQQTRVLVPEFSAPFQSHVTTYGWTFQLGPRTSIAAFGGPNFFEDVDLASLEPVKVWRVTPQASVTFDHGWEKTSLGISYGRSQRQFVGSTGSLITDNLSASFGVTPTRRLSFEFTSGASRSTRQDEAFETYRTGVSGRLELSRWWSIDGSYGYTNQDRGLLFVAAPIETERISRNTAYIGMTIGKTLPLQ